MTDEKCYHITCKSNDLCVPTYSIKPETSEHIVMILVKTVDDESWEEVLQRQGIIMNLYI